jgi:hypothetical protein
MGNSARRVFKKLVSVVGRMCGCSKSAGHIELWNSPTVRRYLLDTLAYEP